MKIVNSVQNWVPFDKFLDNGIIKLKNNRNNKEKSFQKSENKKNKQNFKNNKQT